MIFKCLFFKYKPYSFKLRQLMTIMANNCLKCNKDISESRLYCDECLIKLDPKVVFSDKKE